MANLIVTDTSDALSITELANVPALIQEMGPKAKKRFVEFFTANINNDNTRAAYARAIGPFLGFFELQNIRLDDIEPTHVAAYIKKLEEVRSVSTVKQHLAAIRMMFDYLVTGGLMQVNPVSSVRGPKHIVIKGKTPVLTAEECRELLDSIDVTKMSGIRDRALIGLMVFSFARIGAAMKMNLDDYYQNGKRWFVRLHEKGGKFHVMPCHHQAEEYLDAYLDAGGRVRGKNVPLFRTLNRHRTLTNLRMCREDAWKMIKRRARQSGLSDEMCNHTFRATGITAYMKNGGTLENAQRMAAHSSSRTTSLYDRTSDEVDLEEVNRIHI